VRRAAAESSPQTVRSSVTFCVSFFAQPAGGKRQGGRFPAFFCLFFQDFFAVCPKMFAFRRPGLYNGWGKISRHTRRAEKGVAAMYRIVSKTALNPTVTKMAIEAPLIAKKALPGQFIIVRPNADSERIPLTIAGYDREKGTVDIIFQIVGGTTMELNALEAGGAVHDFVGPLGRATATDGLKKVCVVGGGVGCAIALPIAKELHDKGCVVHSVIGARTKDLLILEDEFKACSEEFRVMTDDGSLRHQGRGHGRARGADRGRQPVRRGHHHRAADHDEIRGQDHQKHGLKTVVSMNPIMIDGTGMCGGCRLTVGGQTKFACVDGPDFDGDLVDFRRGHEARLHVPGL
jgi:ferredoxin--NADP+ reductase